MDFKKFFTKEEVALFEKIDKATSLEETDSLVNEFVVERINEDPVTIQLRRGFDETEEDLRSLLLEEESLLSQIY